MIQATPHLPKSARIPWTHRSAGQRGSALLIVFVLAAAVAVLLYTEIPSALFEARRNREQDLINRGEEYAHGIKLFVRKLGTYPPTLDALNDTNRTRFIRHRFSDPFTGKDDWRLLHAGPAGLLIDSKIKPLPNGDGQNANSLFPGAPVASSASTAISDLSSGFPDTANAATEQLSLPPIPKRPSASETESSAQNAAGTLVDAGPDPTASLLPSSPAETANLAAANLQVGSGAAAPAGGSPVPAVTVDDTPTQGAVTPGASAIGVKFHPDSGPSGLIRGGGIAGVASRADARAIKSINKQTNYSLWEFWYNPLEDPSRMVFLVPPAAPPSSAQPSSTQPIGPAPPVSH